MSLGVLNNLSAMYAENNLNNTTNSLNTVLQQLSSGSRINSGADDAAGLSLVDGLQANSMALTQSQTNATEGVGLLTVADGALSQVTNLLNRAVTLATEASNGTLNSSQDTAANQEYQSILSEVSNIGSTTTYNQQQVFNSTTNIYTGDSSSQGSSIDSLNIRSLSSSNLGDSAGTMSYSSGANNVFIDLSNGGTNAAVTDSLGASTATTTVAVSYMTKGADGATVAATANINVGAGTAYANTAQGLISAINGSGLGITASFGTAAQAGTTSTSASNAANASGGGSTDTGIIISGSGVGTGTNGAGEVGTLTVGGSSDVLGGTLAITGADGSTQTVTLGTANSTDTLANLASTINSAGYGVTASVNNSIVDGHAVGTVLTFTSADSAVTVVGSNVTDASAAAVPGTPGAVTTIASGATVTAGETMASITLNAANQQLGGTLTLNKDAAAAANAMVTSISGVTSAGGVITLGVAGVTDTISNLANFINNNQLAGADLQAVVSNDGSTLSIVATAGVTTGAAITDSQAVTAANTAVTDNLTGTPTTGNTANSNTIGTLTGTTNASVYTAGTLTIGSNAIALGVSGKTDTLADLETTINKGDYGVTASLNAAGTVLTFDSANSAQGFSVTGATVTAADGSINASTNVANQNQIGAVTIADTGVGVTPSSSLTAGDVLSFNNGADTYTTNATDGLTLSDIAAGINAKNWGINAAVTTTGTGTAETTTLTFTSTTAATQGVNVALNATADTTGDTFSTVSDTAAAGKSAYYSIGVSGAITDTTTTGGTLNAGLAGNNNGSGGVATISYSDAAGQSLASTDLTNQTDAQTALTDLNKAITAVAAQDGYVGAQINTLNAVSSVLSTQSENVTSAQNAVQATDYASATSNMSKYEILSQTGISALAQANSMQQEVTKLLQ
jgi:flagellin